jgi:hypothetical protein
MSLNCNGVVKSNLAKILMQYLLNSLGLLYEGEFMKRFAFITGFVLFAFSMPAYAAG